MMEPTLSFLVGLFYYSYLLSNCSVYSFHHQINRVSRVTAKRRVLFSNPKSLQTLIAERQINSDDIESNFNRRIDDWGCMKSCGACCMLGPVDSRPHLQETLSKEEYEQYVSMIGKDNWCVHFDKEQKSCTQFDKRPGFCRVDKSKYLRLFDLEEEDFTVRKTFLSFFFIRQ
jgi:hypothetical protein